MGARRASAVGLTVVLLLVSCGLSGKPVDEGDTPVKESTSTVTFEPHAEIVVGSSIAPSDPLVLVYSPGQRLKSGAQVAIFFPTAVQEETDALWSIPSTDPQATGYVRIDGSTSERVHLDDASRARGGAGKIVLRTTRLVEAGEPIKVLLSGNAPQVVPHQPFRVWEADPDGIVSALPQGNIALPPVVPGAALTVLLSKGADCVAGTPFELHAAAVDAYGNVDTRFNGSLSFQKPSTGLPATYQFSDADNGLHTFKGVVPNALGSAPFVVEATVRVGSGEHVIKSNPSKIWPSRPQFSRYFGDAHFHTGSDVENFAVPGGDHRGQFVSATDAYWYLRNVASLDWGVSAEHDTGLSAKTWLDNQNRVARFNDAGRFVTLSGYEWTPERRIGHHVVIYEGDPSEKNVLYGAASGRRGSGFATLYELATQLRFTMRPNHRVILVPHIMQPYPNNDPERKDHELPHETWDGPEGSRPGGYIFNDIRRVGEIYSHHNDDFTLGDYRQTTSGRGGATNQPQMFELGASNPWSYQHAWVNGHRIGVIGGSDNHLGTPGMNDYAPTVQHHAGLGVVLADDLTRKAVFDALFSRRCYATTGARILLEFTVDHQHMGSEFYKKPGDTVPISISVAGVAPLDTVEVLKYQYGDFIVLKSLNIAGGNTTTTLDFSDRVDMPTIYYVRVRQTDGEMAWTSPIWIDFAG